MVVQSANEAVANANATTTCDPGMCLWQTQEWMESPHAYPDATSQWHAAKYQHPGDDDPPAGAPTFWTGGAHGYGHATVSVGGGKVRSTDQQSSGKVATVPISEIRADWGLTYAGWTEDIGGVDVPYLRGGGDPTNPNGVEVGDECYAVAETGLLLRDAPGGDKTGADLDYGDTVVAGQIEDGWVYDELEQAWCSSDYLFPVLADPLNAAGVKIGDTVTVTANGGLKARVLPGGPQSVDSSGKAIIRAEGYSFDVVDMSDGWAGGGTNWYSTDYLDPTPPPAPADPAWSGVPVVILDDPTPDPDRNVSYLQACVRVAGMTDNTGRVWPECYVVGQDLKNEGNLRFACCAANGDYDGDWFMVNDAGHGQTFHAYRSAAGNLYVWCGEDPAYRYKWQKGKTVSRSSGDKMDYKGSRPVGSYEPWVGFRDATDTKETFYLFDRTDFTDGSNRTTPAKSVTIAKQTKRSQQSWAVSEDRIYRLSGATNDDPPHGSMLHVLEVFDWTGKCLLTFDVTAMAIATTSDEPEGLTFTGTPGDLLAGKREGSTDPAKRSYPIWTVTGLP